MHVVFVEPCFPPSQQEHARALAEVGARVTGIGERPVESLGEDLRRRLSGYVRIGSVTDEGQLENAVRQIQAQGWVDRLEATIESHVLAAAHVRERCGIPGTTSRTAWLCRDKPAMKEVLRDAGIPCAQSTRAQQAQDAWDFVAAVGYPVIVKPLDSAGAAGTYRAANDEELRQAIQASGLADGASVALEEFIEGHEGFYDTLCVEGRVVHDFASHYFPNVLEAMRTRWISPQVVTTNRIGDGSYRELREMGRRVIEVLGIHTSATHMEWFFGPKGLKFSEIGCRPPGVRVWDLYTAANDLDIYGEWAKLVVHGGTDRSLSRRYSAGMIALRPEGDGKIAGYEGLEGIQQRHGAHLVKANLPDPGTPTQPVENGYHANAWMTFRHVDYDALRGILDDVGRSVKVRVTG